jgi:hypothetical protein
MPAFGQRYLDTKRVGLTNFALVWVGGLDCGSPQPETAVGTVNLVSREQRWCWLGDAHESS